MSRIAIAPPAGASGQPPRGILASAKIAFVGIGVITAVINVLYLTGSFYMLEVYDRVIPGRSVPTLVGLSILAFALFCFQGLLDIVRSRLLVRVGASLDARLARDVFAALVKTPLRRPVPGDGLQSLRDLDGVRAFLSGPGPGAFFDLPWIPLYVAICFFFHPWIGYAALIGAGLLVLLTLVTELRTRAPIRETTALAQDRNVLAETGRRNAEVLQAMGMQTRFGARWTDANDRYMDRQARTADIGNGLGGVTKVARLILQSAVLGIGAYLVIHQQASAGIIIAGSILTSRALAPVELAIAHWRSFVGAREGWARLRSVLAGEAAKGSDPLPLPVPCATLAVEAVTLAPPGTQRIVAADVTFGLKAGEALGVIGPSASGKSSLARAIVGVWIPVRGKVRLDGAALDQWRGDDLGRHIGYLPQDVELFAGTVAENIARFEPGATADDVIAAGRAAGIHDMVLRLPAGYETPIGEGGTLLSAGQRQRVALARALYGNPFLVVLDEPNSNLDGEGEIALTDAIAGVRARGGIAVIVAHRPNVLAAVDLLLVMSDGRAQAFGPKDEVMARLMRAPAGAPSPAAGGAVASATPGTPLRIVKDGDAKR